MSRIWKKLIPTGPTLALVIAIVFAAICCRIAFIASEPQDISDIAGYSQLKGGSESPQRARNLLETLSEADYLGDSVEITESEINHYLHLTLNPPKQNGVFNLVTRLDGVWVRLHDGFIELIIERRIQGYKTIIPHQVSYFIKAGGEGEIETSFDGGEMFGGLAVRAASSGELELPRIALPLVRSAAANLAAVYEKELEFLTQKASRLEITEDRVLYVGRGTGRPR